MAPESVTLSTDTESVTLTPDQFERGVAALTAGDPERTDIPRESAFAGDYRPAPELERIALRLIATDRRFGFLADWTASFSFLWKRKGGQSGGVAMLGKCQALGGVARHYAGKSYLIWLAADHCRGLRFTARQVEALVFHQLCHLAPGEVDEETGEQEPPVIVGHDFDGFLAELETYGAWRKELVRAQETLGQLRLWD